MKQQVRNKLHGKAGFTLVELIVVIAILGILAGVGTVGYSGYVKKANEAADQQLLGYINTSFAAACLENGKDVKDITSADLSLTGPVGAKKVDSVSLYDNEFQKYYAGNEDSAFKVFTTIIFDSSKHVFLDAISAGYKAFDYAGGEIYINPDDAEKLGLSAFMTASGLGTQKLLEKVNYVAEFAALLDSATFMQIFGTADYQRSLANYLGYDTTNKTEAEIATILNGEVESLALQKIELLRNNPDYAGCTPEELEAAAGGLVMSNMAILYAAQNSTSQNQDDILSLLIIDQGENPDNAKNQIAANMGTNCGEGLSQAAMAYGLYTAYAYSRPAGSERDQLVANTDNPEAVMDGLSDSGFQEYLKTEQARTDLQGYLSAMNMINSSTGNSTAVSNVIINGFADADLASLLQQVMEN